MGAKTHSLCSVSIAANTKSSVWIDSYTEEIPIEKATLTLYVNGPVLWHSLFKTIKLHGVSVPFNNVIGLQLNRKLIGLSKERPYLVLDPNLI